MCFYKISLLFSKGKDACYRNEFQVGIYSVIKLMFTLGYNVHVCSCNLGSYKDPVSGVLSYLSWVACNYYEDWKHPHSI